MRKNIFLWLIILLVKCVINVTPVIATEPLTGESIARLAFNRDRGESSFSRATMILEHQKGNKRSRTFMLYRICNNGLERRLVRFISPADIKGTGFLMIELPGYETEQFLYLPALRRSRRIVSSQKYHPFVNSDFTYEDMERQPVENYVYTLTGEKKINDIDCYIIEINPRESLNSQYSMIRAGITKNSYVTILAEYYDLEGIHIKTFRVLELEQRQNIWTETMTVMENTATRHKTYIILDHIEYNIKITPDQISRPALESDMF